MNVPHDIPLTFAIRRLDPQHAVYVEAPPLSRFHFFVGCCLLFGLPLLRPSYEGQQAGLGHDHRKKIMKRDMGLIREILMQVEADDTSPNQTVDLEIEGHSDRRVATT